MFNDLWFVRFPQCLSIVLDNDLSHPVLEKLLPTLKYSLHDVSEKVRTAFLDMLIKVKAVRAAKVPYPSSLPCVTDFVWSELCDCVRITTHE